MGVRILLHLHIQREKRVLRGSRAGRRVQRRRKNPIRNVVCVCVCVFYNCRTITVCVCVFLNDFFYFFFTDATNYQKCMCFIKIQWSRDYGGVIVTIRISEST